MDKAMSEEVKAPEIENDRSVAPEELSEQELDAIAGGASKADNEETTRNATPVLPG